MNDFRNTWKKPLSQKGKTVLGLNWHISDSVFFCHRNSCTGTQGRHPGQGPRDPALPVPEIWDRDRDWDSFWNPGLSPGLKSEKSGTRDWDRDASKNPGPEPGLTIFSSGTEILSNPGNFPEHGPGPVPTPVFNYRGMVLTSNLTANHFPSQIDRPFKDQLSRLKKVFFLP